MKVTLIYVGVGVAGFSDHRPIGDREGSWIGHGIASIGAAAKLAGHDVSLIDMRQLSGYDQLEEVLKSDPAAVYGLSVSAVDHWHALRTVIMIKRVSPESKVIVGGIHPSIFPGQYDYEAIDCVVQGEGEVTFVGLLNNIELGVDIPRQIRGVKPDLNKIQWVDRELFDYKRELGCFFTPDQGLPSITMLAGRGCAFKCAYCQPAENAVFGHPFRMRSPDNVINELLYLKGRYKFKSITFWDDTFTFRTPWVKDFCDLYEASKIGAPIVACSRADIICKNEGMIERMAEVGVTWLVIGLESGSQRVLDFISKGTTVEQNIRAANICRKNGIKVFGTFMYGLPTETNDEALDTARMIDEIRPDHASPFWFVPIPGTKIHTYCAENDLILDETKRRTIERTGQFRPAIKGVDYQYLNQLLQGYRRPARNVEVVA